MRFGLTEKKVECIKEVLGDYPEVKEARIFGSRAKKTARNGSDIDIALIGKNIKHKIFLSLLVDLDNLKFPYTFDVVVYSNIKETALKEHIIRVGVLFYQKDTALKTEK